MNIAQIPTELKEFKEWLKGRKIENILEIGVFEGGTVLAWREVFPEAYILGIDIGIGTDELRELAKKNRIELMLTTDSHDYKTLEKIKDKSFDFLFIDGDHSYAGVKKDFKMYSPLVKKGGIVVFHDIKDTQRHRDINCFVADFWKEIKVEYEHKTIVDESVGWGGIGILYV